MILIIPVSANDIHLLEPLAQVFRKQGGLSDFGIFICPSPSVEEDARRIGGTIADLAREYRVLPLEVEPTGGWPLAANEHFRGVIEIWSKLEIEEPFMWFEPDCCFLQADGPNLMLTEYNLSKKPYMGFVRRTSEVWPGQEGHHMVAGGAIYSPHFGRETTLWQYPRAEQPFDVFTRWVTVGDGSKKCHPTKLVRHLWHTVNYRFEEGEIVCDTMPDEKDKTKPIQRLVVGLDAVLVHGCKDGSLARLLCGEGPSERPKVDNSELERVQGEEINAKIETALAGEKLRAHHLAEKMEISVQELEKMMAHPACTYELKGPVKLVVKKAAKPQLETANA